MWDLICVGEQDIRFVQVKTNKSPDKEWKVQAESWPCPKCVVREWIVYVDYSKGNTPSSRVIMSPYERKSVDVRVH